MKRKQVWWLMTIAILSVGVIGVSQATADPYEVFPQQIRDLGDVTAANHGPPGQLSTIDNISTSPGGVGGGIHLDVTYRVGNTAGCDPILGCGPDDVLGLDFARVSLGTVYPPNFTGPTDLSGFDGIKWSLMSDVDLQVQPWVKTSDNFTYWEPPSPIFVPGDMQMHMAILDLNDAVNFAGLPNGTVQDLDNVKEWGLQISASAEIDALGSGLPARIWITSKVPEPTSFALLGLGLLGLTGLARRRLA